MFSSILGKIFRREKEYVLFLARRGRPLEIERLVARDIREAKIKAQEIIENLSEEEIPDLKKYRYFVVVNEDTGERARIRNPFYEPESEDLSPIDIEKITLASIANKIPDIVAKSIDTAFSISTTIQHKMLEKTLEMIGFGEPRQPDLLDKLIEIGKMILEMKQAEEKRKASR